MELDWSTYILEIVNFAVLVWLLVHFFYRPVMNIIASRRQSIQETLDKAEQARTEADALKFRFENRLSEWEQERGLERTRLHAELEQERKHARDVLEQELAEIRTRARAGIERERNNTLMQAHQLATAQGLAFTARLLERLAEPALESKLITLALEDMVRLDAEALTQLRQAFETSNDAVQVTSVWPMDTGSRASLIEAMNRVFGSECRVEFHRDSSLVAGICIDVGSYRLDANLKAELAFFGMAKRANGDR